MDLEPYGNSPKEKNKFDEKDVENEGKMNIQIGSDEYAGEEAGPEADEGKGIVGIVEIEKIDRVSTQKSANELRDGHNVVMNLSGIEDISRTKSQLLMPRAANRISEFYNNFNNLVDRSHEWARNRQEPSRSHSKGRSSKDMKRRFGDGLTDSVSETFYIRDSNEAMPIRKSNPGLMDYIKLSKLPGRHFQLQDKVQERYRSTNNLIPKNDSLFRVEEAQVRSFRMGHVPISSAEPENGDDDKIKIHNPTQNGTQFYEGIMENTETQRFAEYGPPKYDREKQVSTS